MDRVEDLLRHQLEVRPSALAFYDSSGARWTYADLDRACDDLAVHLAQSGVQRGDRVLILSENCCAKVAALFACYRLGAVAVPVNARQTQAEIERIQGHATPVAAVLTTSVSPDAQAHAAWMNAREITGRFGAVHLARTGQSNPDAPDDLAVLLYTTGTTGDPKGVMLSHANLLFGGRTSAELRNMTIDDVIYGVLPTTHVFGLASVVTAAIHIGAPVQLEARFSAARLYQALREGVTLLSAVPQMHALLMQYTKEQGFDRLEGSALRYVSSGAAPLDPDWKRRAEAFYGVAVQNGYGMTETTAGICATSNRIGVPDVSVGPPLPEVNVRLDETVSGGGGGLGEVLVQGPNVMLGYYRNPAETMRALDRDGWMRTGDLGRFDAAGLLHIDGRAKELIIHGGFNVFPPEVEAALNAHPQVVQSAVVGRRADGDEEVVAFVQVASGDMPDTEELRAFVASQLAGYKRPSQIILAPSLPAAPTGKILKHKLLGHFADQLA
ncbi:class I adenylate-forming enzyme family protein [Aliisedimentitalea scapharcae]|uniref:Class I adenylate-forming enzyme family protein n=1 Tax=Aliisedimentitalea scapharcae TaxID=1524259 RepID=A0ABZ2XUU5_9RHOB